MNLKYLALIGLALVVLSGVWFCAGLAWAGVFDGG